jgi:hypothetical protein
MRYRSSPLRCDRRRRRPPHPHRAEQPAHLDLGRVKALLKTPVFIDLRNILSSSENAGGGLPVFQSGQDCVNTSGTCLRLSRR